MSEPGDSILLSRNGRPAACDPCRARKVACDHSRPICNRCRKRKQTSRCQYPDLGKSAPPSIPLVQDAAMSPSGSPSDRIGDEPLSNSEATGVSSRPGYLGYTSYNNIFDETESYLALLSGSNAQVAQTSHNTTQSQSGISFRNLPLPLRQTCLLVLRSLPGQSNEQMVFPQNLSTPKGWAHIAVDRIIRSLRDDFGNILANGGTALETMAEILCSNTAKPIRDYHSDPQLWIDQFCGQNIRWESIGLLWVHLVGVSDVVDSLLCRSIEWVGGKKSLMTARAYLVYCIEISTHFTEANDLLLDLSRRRTTLSSQIDGDARISSFSSHGSTVSMMTYLGLHALENDASYTPSLCSENKRRLVAQIFTSDKLGVAFTGRPPLISRRYCSTPLPLDIGDEDLTSEKETLMRAFYSLDSYGWNTRGELYSATVIRARCMFAVIREELIEMSLSKQVTTAIDHLKNIKARQAATMSSFPESLKYYPDNLTDPNMETRKLYIRILIQLEHILNNFFADRLLLRQGWVDEGDLLASSFELVSLTVKLWTNKDRFTLHSMKRNFDWLVMAHGAPGGGILCQELLYPTFTGTHPKNPSLTRSSIVQQLSLLVGFLDWIHPSAPNGDICADTKAIIQRVLDHHLNAQSQSGVIYETMDWGVMSQPDFNFELMDTFEWLRKDNTA